jgi:hypothetical protein
MSTALSVIDRSLFVALNPESEAAMAMKENMVEGDSFSMSDLVRVKTPSGGGLFWTVEGVAGESVEKEIEGVMVFQARQGTLWPSLETTTGKRPVMSTNDMKHGKLQIPEEEIPAEILQTIKQHEISPGVFDWPALPYTQFGSGKNGVGKFAKESRVLFILRKDEMFPLVIRVGPGSLKTVTQFIMRLQVPYYRAIIGLTLKKETSKGGQDYSRIIPTLKGVLDPDSGKVVQESYTNLLKASWEAGRIEVEDDGPTE